MGNLMCTSGLFVGWAVAAGVGVAQLVKSASMMMKKKIFLLTMFSVD